MLRRKTEIDWLVETEQMDGQSVNEMVLGEVHRWLGSRSRSGGASLRITELGCGIGGNRRRLSQGLTAPQHWTMVEFNPDVAEYFRKQFKIDADDTTDLVCPQGDAANDCARHVDGADLLILSGRSATLPQPALLDVLAKARQQGTAVYAALQPTGFVKFEPESTDDQSIHQMASASGMPQAAALIEAMEETGFRVLKGESDWIVQGVNESFWHSRGRKLQRHFLQRYLGAARRNHPDQAAGLLAWANKRSVLIERKKTTITVGHADILAIPEDRE